MNAFPRQPGSNATAISPFRVNVPEVELDELRNRINATKFPELEPVTDESQGMPLASMETLARYWAQEYDWRRIEAKLNSCPQFVTEIDGLDIYFIHVRSKHPDALPLIVTHGWPGSVVQHLKTIDPLTDPTAHGGTESDAFDVVLPSMPGYGFSGKPTAPGWDPARIARAWPVLMRRLGYTRYVAQGGDWGAIVTELMAAQAPPGLIGIHTNMPAAVPPDVDAAAAVGAPTPSALSVDERHAYENLVRAYRDLQYAYLQRSRPQTLYALADSPVGLAAWILDPPLISRFQSPDDVLDNITLYWLTNTAVSSARLYWENKTPYFAPRNVTMPVGVSVFPGELFQTPRSWAERAYPRLVHYNKLHEGGHFPAWEQPDLYVAELRAAFRSLR